MLGRLYPLQQENLEYSTNDYSETFLNAAEFRTWLDGIPGLFNHFGNPIDFKTLYPLYTFNLSKQVAKLKSSVVDIKIQVKFRNRAHGTITTAYALLISDITFSLTSDGSKMNVIYTQVCICTLKYILPFCIYGNIYLYKFLFYLCTCYCCIFVFVPTFGILFYS